MVQIREITDYQTFLSLRSTWNSLLEKSSFCSIFVRHEWIRCWWEAYGNSKQLLILLFEDGGDLKGIAPLMISKVLFRGLPVRRISFIENDETPHCGIINDESYDISIVIEALFSYLSLRAGKWDIIFLRKVREYSYLLKYLQRAIEEGSRKIIIRPHFSSPFLRIKTDWKSFYSAKSQRFKKKIRYDQNKLKRVGEFKTQLFDTPEQIADIIEDVYCVGFRSWKGKIKTSIGSTQQNRSFFAKLPRALSNEKNGVLLWTLSLDSKMISFEYHVRQNNIVYALRGEYDEEYQTVGPGAVLDHEVVRNMFDNGVKLYDMCGDSKDQYKLRWTSEVQPYGETIVFNSGPYAKILAYWEHHITPIAKRYVGVIGTRHFRF